MVRNKSLIYNSLPHGLPVPGKDLVVKESELDTNSIPEGAIVIKNLWVSTLLIRGVSMPTFAS